MRLLRHAGKNLDLLSQNKIKADTEYERQGHHVTIAHIYWVETPKGKVKMYERELNDYIDKLLDIEDNHAYSFVFFSNGAIV